MIPARQAISLPDLTPPQLMEVDAGHLYLGGRTSISILSIDGMKIKAQFGTKGEGPGEFIPIDNDMGLGITAESDGMMVSSRGKISWFSKSGALIREQKAKRGEFFKSLAGGKAFVGLTAKIQDQTVYNVVTLFDAGLNPVKDLYQRKHWFQQGKKIDPVNVRAPRYCVSKDRIFIDDNQAGCIRIYDRRGTTIGKTTVQIDRMPVTQADRQAYHQYYRNHPIYKNYYANLKHIIQFPSHYPIIQFFDVADQRIYLFSHIREAGKSELYIFNLDGKLLKKTDIPIAEINRQEVFPLIRVKNSRVYQLIENIDDEEQLDLIITKIGGN